MSEVESDQRIQWAELSVEHETLYRYGTPVDQAHHLACLRPLVDGGQKVQDFSLQVTPMPAQLRNRVDDQAEADSSAGLGLCRSDRHHEYRRWRRYSRHGRRARCRNDWSGQGKERVQRLDI